MLVTRVEKVEAVTPDAGGRFRIFRFALEATIEGPIDPAHGMVVNIVEIKERLQQDVVQRFSGYCLDGENGLPACRTPEDLARAIWQVLGGRLAGAPLHRIRLIGDPSPVVECHGEGSMNVTRVYEFSASHRLHNAELSDDENVRLFGKCNNPRGHGHNYVIEVTLRGDPEPGRELVPGAEFDRVVNEAIVERWDHKNLNEDLPEFAGRNPTAEEIARVAWGRVRESIDRRELRGVELDRIKLRETERNHVEYRGE